jgi:hypothetical protein
MPETVKCTAGAAGVKCHNGNAMNSSERFTADLAVDSMQIAVCM